MKKIKDFIIEEKKIVCNACYEPMNIDSVSRIRISTYDSQHRYQGSKRKFIINYKLNLCPSCFNVISKKLTETVIVESAGLLCKLSTKKFKDVISKKHKTK